MNILSQKLNYGTDVIEYNVFFITPIFDVDFMLIIC